MNKVLYRRVDFSSEAEMIFIADTDTQIPAKFDDEFPTDEKMILERLKHFKEKFNQEDFFQVALDGQKIVGFHLIKKHSHFNNKNVGNVYTLWVSSEYRRSGIAKELKRQGEAWAKNSNLDHLYTWVHVDNSKMLNLNKKLGYEPTNIKMVKKI